MHLGGTLSDNPAPRQRSLVAAFAFESGIVKYTVVPAPGVETNQIRPPWASTMRLQIASPRPVPGYSA